jgi:hypothetical protein
MALISIGRLVLGIARIGGMVAQAASAETRKTAKLRSLKERNAKRARIASLNDGIKAEKQKGRRS